jgi:hypothetical protein
LRRPLRVFAFSIEELYKSCCCAKMEDWSIALPWSRIIGYTGFLFRIFGALRQGTSFKT